MNRRWMYGVTGIALVASSLVGVLTAEVRALRPLQSEVRRLRSIAHVGQWFPRTPLITSVGDTLVMGETAPQRAQLLIFFSPKCAYCLASLPAWRIVSDSLLRDSADRFDVVWISGGGWDSTTAYAKRHNLPYTITRFADSKMPLVLKTRAVPLTIVLDRFGRVEHVQLQAVSARTSVDSLIQAAYRAAAADSLSRRPAAARTAVR